MAIDQQKLLGMVSDIIAKESKFILTVGWDGDAPGTSGALWVTRWRDRLYFYASSDAEEHGPFSTLEEVLAQKEFETLRPKPELMSNFLKMPRLKEIALPLVAAGAVVRINGRGFQKQDGVLVRLKSP